jgi:DNA polymerase III subunit delta'
LLPTIRSRSVVFQMSRLSDSEMQQFASARKLPESQTRVELAEGCPGLAVTLDLEQLRSRRALILAALECAAGLIPFSAWVQHSESFSNSRSEKLESYLKVFYGILRDILSAWHGKPPVMNRDVAPRIAQIAGAVSFSWIERATAQVDELVVMVRRNIQKTAALDALIINLRNSPASAST